jgi:putative CocE/NonD family hydrolase
MRWAWLLAIVGVGCVRPAGVPEPEARTGPSFHERVPMADGVELYTKVHLPDGQGPFPVVFSRLPYDGMGVLLDQRCALYNRHGYACAWQYVRGRAKSDGAWVPFEHEPTDGKAALDWLVAQPWCDGNIALTGESYLGAVQWAIADDLPPQVKTIIPSVIGTDLYASAYEGGAFRHEILTAWMSLMPDHDFRFMAGSRGYQKALAHRPRLEADVVATGRELPWWRAWVEADRPFDPFWNREIATRAQEAPEHTTVPVLMIGGWADAFTGPMMDTWERLATKETSTLVIGPWDHLGRVSTDVEQRGLDDKVGLSHKGAQTARVLDWLGHHLRGRPLEYGARVVTYPVNGWGWVARPEWPPQTIARTFHLQPGVSPAACTGALGSAAGSGEVSFVYDPEDPTPSAGGAGLLAGVLPGWKGVTPGFVDQGTLCEDRWDLLGFVSAPLSAPLHVAGELEATIRFASDAPDSAVNVRVLEQRADGRRIHVRESIVVLSFRDGPGTVAPYTPGEVVDVPLVTWPVEYVFEAGSRVVVEVASASFPKYEAHSNLAEPWERVASTARAQQTVVLEGSSVTLPVLAPR